MPHTDPEPSPETRREQAEPGGDHPSGDNRRDLAAAGVAHGEVGELGGRGVDPDRGDDRPDLRTDPLEDEHVDGHPEREEREAQGDEIGAAGPRVAVARHRVARWFGHGPSLASSAAIAPPVGPARRDRRVCLRGCP